MLIKLTYLNIVAKYIKSCKVREADFKACAIKNGNDAFKTLLKGEYNFISKLNFPTKISHIIKHRKLQQLDKMKAELQLFLGDPKYNIPPADPIIFPSATVVSDNVNLNSTNISLHGLTDSVLTDVE